MSPPLPYPGATAKKKNKPDHDTGTLGAVERTFCGRAGRPPQSASEPRYCLPVDAPWPRAHPPGAQPSATVGRPNDNAFTAGGQRQDDKKKKKEKKSHKQPHDRQRKPQTAPPIRSPNAIGNPPPRPLSTDTHRRPWRSRPGWPPPRSCAHTRQSPPPTRPPGRPQTSTARR